MGTPWCASDDARRKMILMVAASTRACPHLRGTRRGKILVVHDRPGGEAARVASRQQERPTRGRGPLRCRPVINVGLALLFGFFVLRYTERERGMMHMEYGQHAFKNMTDMFDQNNVKSLGESLAMVQHTLQEGNEQEGARGARGAHKGARRVEGV